MPININPKKEVAYGVQAGLGMGGAAAAAALLATPGGPIVGVAFVGISYLLERPSQWVTEAILEKAGIDTNPKTAETLHKIIKAAAMLAVLVGLFYASVHSCRALGYDLAYVDALKMVGVSCGLFLGIHLVSNLNQWAYKTIKEES